MLRYDPRLDRIRHVFEAVFRWLVHKLHGFYSAVGLFLAVGLGLALLAIVGFAALAESVIEGNTRRLDEGVLLWMNQFASARMDLVALEITALGDGVVVTVLVLVCSLLLWLTRNRHLAVTLWVATAGGMLINTVLKLAFDRPRPQLFEWRTDYAGLSSFPSGHASTAMVVYVALAYVVARLEPGTALRRMTFSLFALLVVLIGLSRLYLGVHYPSDVIAGYAVGLAWAMFSAFAVEAIRHARVRPGADPPADASPLRSPGAGSPATPRSGSHHPRS